MAANERFPNAASSSCHCAVSRVIEAAESPWLVPRNWVNAGTNWPVDIPCRYSNGNTSAICGDFRHQAGRIAEANLIRSPVATSMRCR